MDGQAQHVASTEFRNAWRTLVGKPEGREQRPRYRWENNIKADVK